MDSVHGELQGVAVRCLCDVHTLPPAFRVRWTQGAGGTTLGIQSFIRSKCDRPIARSIAFWMRTAASFAHHRLWLGPEEGVALPWLVLQLADVLLSHKHLLLSEAGTPA